MPSGIESSLHHIHATLYPAIHRDYEGKNEFKT
ncbi:hypothetical protein YPPY59_3584, partial [Yersinia pestis PY-59]